MTLNQIDKMIGASWYWSPPKRGIILRKSARSGFNARRFSDRMNVDFKNQYRKTVKPQDDPERLNECGVKGTYKTTG